MAVNREKCGKIFNSALSIKVTARTREGLQESGVKEQPNVKFMEKLRNCLLLNNNNIDVAQSVGRSLTLLVIRLHAAANDAIFIGITIGTCK